MGWRENLLVKSATSRAGLVSGDIPEMTRLRRVKGPSL